MKRKTILITALVITGTLGYFACDVLQVVMGIIGILLILVGWKLYKMTKFPSVFRTI